MTNKTIIDISLFDYYKYTDSAEMESRTSIDTKKNTLSLITIGATSVGVILLAWILIRSVYFLKRLSYVKCGRFTYGVSRTKIKRYHKNDGKLIIGDFCSIAKNVTIYLGNGIHDTKYISTYPFFHPFARKVCIFLIECIYVLNPVFQN